MSRSSRASGSRPAGFPRSARLLKRSEFDRVYRGGRRHFSAHLAAYFLSRPSAGGSARVGLTVGRVLGGAVVRNRLRRRLREAVRLSLHRLPETVDVVLHPRKSALALDFRQLAAEVERAFEAARRPGIAGERQG